MKITEKEIKIITNMFEELGEKRFNEYDDEEKTLLSRYSEEENEFLKRVRKEGTK